MPSTSTARRVLVPALLIAAVLAGCGSDDEPAPAPPPAAEQTTQESTTTQAKKERTGTVVHVDDSEFGTMIYGPRNQAIYIFQRDSKGKTNCYGECAAAWPPVITRGEPRAQGGAKQPLLGTVKRRDGSLQVTYAGQPLYFYANEGPGQVRCHNVDLNGGLWWVIGPDGKRRA
jgi:predicted lipoprotein with Yx(FWY)xxD motif